MNLEFGIPCHPVVTNHWHPKLNPKVLLASAKILPSDLRASARTSLPRGRPWPFAAHVLCWVCLDQRPNGPNPGRAVEGEVRLEGPFAGSTPKRRNLLIKRTSTPGPTKILPKHPLRVQIPFGRNLRNLDLLQEIGKHIPQRVFFQW